MAAALFSVFYNIILTVVLALAVCSSYYLFRQRKHSMPIAMCAVFCAYLLDNTIVFCTEIIPEFASAYNEIFVKNPSVKTVYFIVLIGSLLYALHSVMPSFTVQKMAGTVAIYAALLICIPMISQNDWMVYIYYFTTQLLVISTCIWCLAALWKNPDASGLSVLRQLLLYFLFMSILVLVEDTVVIFFLDRYDHGWLQINNRNFAENFLYLGLAARIALSAGRCLQEVTAPAAPSPAENLPAPEGPQSSTTQAFASAYNLTDREQEILALLVQAKSQQEISDELVIALGTVKTHIHNIYHKTGSANRSQFMAKYQQFCHR